MFPPKNLLCQSDENELEYISTGKVNKEVTYTYRYTKSISKLKSTLTLLEVDLKNYIKSNIFIEI